MSNKLLLAQSWFTSGTICLRMCRFFDTWILARLNQVIAESTAGYESYQLDDATRPIADFVDDLSTWYLRRSRDRIRLEVGEYDEGAMVGDSQPCATCCIRLHT